MEKMLMQIEIAQKKGERKIFQFLKKFYLLILERRERNIDLWFHSFMHSLVATCMCLTRDGTCNLSISGQCSNQLSHLTKVKIFQFLKTINKLTRSHSRQWWESHFIFILLIYLNKNIDDHLCQNYLLPQLQLQVGYI